MRRHNVFLKYTRFFFLVQFRDEKKTDFVYTEEYGKTFCVMIQRLIRTERIIGRINFGGPIFLCTTHRVVQERFMCEIYFDKMFA